MEEDSEPSALSNPNPSSSICGECNQNPSKYKCPACSFRTCSLACVKSHKQRTTCSGKRSRTDFVPLAKFDDKVLISDYSLLEETKRVSESAQRLRDGLCSKFGFKMPLRLKQLRNAAFRRKTRLWLLPGGMSRKAKNQSRYDQRKKSILWTIEWQFHSTNIVLIDNGVDEYTSLSSVIEKHLKPGPWNHQLSPFCKEQLEHLKFFIRKNPKGSKSPYREIDIMAPISHQLADVIIVEYPTIQVYLPTHTYDFEVEKVAAPKVLSKPLQELPSPMGVPFKEEEIEVDSSDIQVLDLLKCGNLESLDDCQIPEEVLFCDRGVDQEVKSSNSCLGKEFQALITPENDGYYGSIVMESGILEGFDFEFGQDLRDAYSSLIDQVNLDDYLCMEDGFIGEELEEGEILEL